MKTGRCVSRRGFTLIEVMVAIALLMLVVGAIYSTWTGLIKASKTGMKAAVEAQRQRMAMSVVEEALTSAQLYVANQDYYGFEAGKDSGDFLSFVARLPRSFPRSGKFEGMDMRRVIFSVENDNSGQRELVLRQNPVLAEMDEDEQKFPVVLAQGVRAFKAEFWDDRKADWVEDWIQTNTLPKMVRVTLEMGNGNRYSGGPVQTTMRVVGLPTAGVTPTWQTIGAGGRPPQGGPPGGSQPIVNPLPVTQ